MNIFFVLLIVCHVSLALEVLDDNFWRSSAMEDLKESLKVQYNTKVAKNVILFIGDGMGPNTVTAARIYSEGEHGYLAWERFPHVGAIKTYAADKQVPDSANTATALYTGSKTNLGTLGVTSAVKRKHCNASTIEGNRLTTIATMAQEAGKSTGIITTTRITHATPAAMYAHSADRDWECNSVMPPGSSECKDIARQLVEDNPGKNFNVIMGGGRQFMKDGVPDLPEDPVTLEHDGCVRTDGRDLIAEWAQGKKSQGLSYAVVNDTKSLLSLDTSKTDYLLGVFHNAFLPYEYKRDKSEKGVPSLEQMTKTAVNILKKNKNGFVLMVEGGLIDVAHHIGKARISLDEVVALNAAINSTMKLLESEGIKDDTLVIVTSDHSHTLTLSGYPDRGNNILGIAGVSKVDNVSYTTLSYANSLKNNYHYITVNGSVVREDPSKVDTTSYDYGHQTGVLVNSNTHGGSDVFVYATGPFAHLFHRIHEQSYVPYVIQYACRIGEFATTENSGQTSGSWSLRSSVILIVVIQFFYLFK